MKKGIILYLAVLFSCTLHGQQEIKMLLDKYSNEKEAILNTVINSSQFDSINAIYHIEKPILLKNEILNDTSLMLNYKGEKVDIMDHSLIKDSPYWDLGDFFLNIYVEDPKDARVQIILVLKEEEVIIGITLQKTEEWRINNFTFVE